MKKIAIFIFVLFIPFFVFAQENSSDLENDLFGGDEDTLISAEEARSDSKSNLKFKADLEKASLSLESKKLRIGGSLSSSMGINYAWVDPYSKKDDYLKSFKDGKGSFNTTLNGSLFFDARPNEDLKLYGKFLFGFPFEKSLSGQGAAFVPKSIVPPNGLKLPAFVEVSGVPNIKIQELYTDFSAKDIAFFRFGKHAVKWGTGYFYSPADVINISRIDPQDPTADREGGISLRTHIIIPKTQHNIWLYLLPPEQRDGYDPKYTAGAAKGEFVVGNWELGFGGWYKYEKAPRLITTVSGSIAGKVAVFGEGVFAWGSDYTYYKADMSPYTEKNKPFFQATLGGSYSNADTNTGIVLQYFYNGFGYSNTDVPQDILSKAAVHIKNKNYTHPSVLASGDIFAMGNIGQHYIALNISQNKLGTDKLSLNFFQQFAISELEGFSKLTLNWRIYKFASMSTGPSFSYPLSPNSKTKGEVRYSLSFRLGGGTF
ncbi:MULTISPECIES: hypothetical protein [Treponema]|uniref:Uncharacterized protein n=1 Tax=Treponema denticola (strain ATCC 35405 / DSM 14222 / CIP 103919 / JCM 8153 / KCTC 15104) TaxID=243275 RepID=Q73LL4_TREDE|nr:MULTISPECIES: hypothetical protein [Treponema]AAS12363.1 hypothetical protein TDE_1848 [Treponema denticola ATCC 35405]EMB38164.1 hypothetical protein HMPREF9735_01270 [Treponema denticola ATCC 33521]EMB39695.1 hypothetical protein HMPREF9721_00564 [Treponema denticola ATCC 35404]HCY95958.1 hypothetical protein [Treponema sp.]